MATTTRTTLTLGAYVSTMTTLQAARVRNTMNRPHRLNGVVMQREEVARTLAARDGFRVDRAAGRVYVGESFFLIRDLTATLVAFAEAVHAHDAAVVARPVEATAPATPVEATPARETPPRSGRSVGSPLRTATQWRRWHAARLASGRMRPGSKRSWPRTRMTTSRPSPVGMQPPSRQPNSPATPPRMRCSTSRPPRAISTGHTSTWPRKRPASVSGPRTSRFLSWPATGARLNQAAIVTPAAVDEAGTRLRDYYTTHVAEFRASRMVALPVQQQQACAAPCQPAAPVEEIVGCIHLPPEVLELRDRGALFVVNHSAGKDSQAMLLFLRRFIPRAQLVLIHADLGRVEWPGNVEHINATADGLPLIVAKARRDLLQMVRERFASKPEVPSWPSPSNRQCTSDLKRGPIEREVRRYLKAHPEHMGLVVNCLGMRAQESTARAKLPVMKHSTRNSVAGRKWLDFHPIHDWSVGKVWATIAGAGQEPHPVYGKGMSRLSCRFCIMASEADLTTAAGLSPDLYREYCEVERDTGYSMSMSGRTLPEITGIDPWAVQAPMVAQPAQQAQAKATARPEHGKAWEAQARAAGWVRDASGAWGRPGFSTLAGMVRQPVQLAQADASEPEESVTPTHPGMVEVCAAIARAGFTAYMRSPGDTYAYLRDGERVGTVGIDRLCGVVLSSVHIPNTTTGTGFRMVEDIAPAELDREMLSVAFRAGPHWALGYQLAASRKWPTFAAFRKAEGWGGGLKPVRFESQK